MSFKVLYYYHFLFFFSFLTFFPYLLFFGKHCASCCDLSFIFLLLCMLAKSIYIFFFFEVHFFWFTCHPIYVAYYLDYDSSDGRFLVLWISLNQCFAFLIILLDIKPFYVLWSSFWFLMLSLSSMDDCCMLCYLFFSNLDFLR